MAATTTIKKLTLVVAVVLALLAAVAPAMAAEGVPSGQQVNGKFVLVLGGSSGSGAPVHAGQTYFVSQRGLDTDPTAPICTTSRPTGMAQACHVDRNVLPFAGTEGHRLSYRIWMRDDKAGKVTTIKSGSRYIHDGMVIGAKYGF
jgi:hypothetical protein